MTGPGPGGAYTAVPAAGRIVRNLIHGADTVMSHITHFYHLAALDYVDASFLNHPAKPSVPATDMIPGTNSPGHPLNAAAGLGWILVNSYVAALGVRRDCHTMGAIFSGRQPMQNAMIPGGVSTLLDATWRAYAIPKFNTLLTSVRNFIDNTYIPNVLTVADYYGFGNNDVYGLGGAVGQTNYFAYGTGHGSTLSYGDFDVDGQGTLLLKRGRVHRGAAGSGPSAAKSMGVDQQKIREYIGFSRYEAYSGFGTVTVAPGTDANGDQCRHPFDNETKPQFNKTNAYSWMKAPRYLSSGLAGEVNTSGAVYAANTPIPYEVGPLARVLATAVHDLGLGTIQGGASQTVPDSGPLGLGSYSMATLVQTVLGALALPLLPSAVSYDALFSVLGRHGARAMEAKFLADAMSLWSADLAALTPADPGYLYMKIPKQVRQGVGLVEAPRGALGHWITTEKKRVVSYACVVPSTWNISPRADNGTPGAAEQTIISAGTLDPSASGNSANEVVNILRLLHPFDFCSACAIHLVTADKKKFTINMETDGSPVTVIPAE